MSMEKAGEYEMESRVESPVVANGGANKEVNGLDTNVIDHAPMGKTTTVTTDGSHVEAGASDLSPAHRDYLIARHGTTDLSPLPTMDPADPLNWPAWKVRQTPQSAMRTRAGS